MTKRVKWGVTAAIFLMIAGMIVYPQVKNQLTASGKDSVVVPAPGTGVRKQVLNINAEVLKFQSLTDKVISTGSIIPDEEVDLSFESSGKVVNIYFSEGTHVKAGDLLGFMGDTGYSRVEGTTGNFPVHLHLGIYLVEGDQEISVNPYYPLRYVEDRRVKCAY